MAVNHTANRLILSADNNGSDTDALVMVQTGTKVFVHFANEVSGTLTPKQGVALDRLIPFSVNNAGTYEATITGSITFIVDGPGLLAFGCADIDGVITIDTEEALV